MTITQRQQIRAGVVRRGWMVRDVDSAELEWWADELWELESRIRPQGSSAWLAFLVDPQAPSNRRPGTHVWAVGLAPRKPTELKSFLCTVAIRHRWERAVAALYERLDSLRRPGMTITCRQCGSKLPLTQPYAYHAGFGDEEYGYCDRCPTTVTFSWFDPHYSDRLSRRQVESRLRPCPCGGTFRLKAKPRCPHCRGDLLSKFIGGVYYLVLGEHLSAERGDRIWR
jgi:hypothetical protein